jgi:FAD binding domain/Berberine and berberine like
MITPGNPSYDEWNNRGFNQRLKAYPKAIIPVSTVDDLLNALQEALDQQQHVVVRGGGHCLENFVSNPSVEIIIDISGMKGIRYDPAKNAIEVMAGETVGEMHKRLSREWGIVLPVGEHPDIGMGGHIAGGAFGFLCRKYGLGVDHLYALEVLCVDKNRKAHKVVCSREYEDRNRELWWAHTGGGTGNFGIVTRYWFRSPNVSSVHPRDLLPRAPKEVETLEISWDWNEIDEAGFSAIVRNYGTFIENNSGSGIIAREFFGTLILSNRVTGKILLQCLVTDTSYSELILNQLIRSVHPQSGLSYHLTRKKMSWLDFALDPFANENAPKKIAFKFKDAFLLKPYSEAQIKTIYKYVSDRTDTAGAAVGMASYGGKINEVDSDATACAQRNVIFATSTTPVWENAEEEDKYMDWARSCYRDLYAESGGCPVPGTRTAGCIIAHPDNDLADPKWNKTGVPWYTFYYLDHYPRLQKIKADWDPLNIFHHALSVKPKGY